MSLNHDILLRLFFSIFLRNGIYVTRSKKHASIHPLDFSLGVVTCSGTIRREKRLQRGRVKGEERNGKKHRGKVGEPWKAPALRLFPLRSYVIDISFSSYSLYPSSSILLFSQSTPKSFLRGNYLMLGRNPKKDDSMEKYFKLSNPLSGSTARNEINRSTNWIFSLYACVCVCIYICIYVYTCIYMYAYVCMYIRKRILFVNNKCTRFLTKLLFLVNFHKLVKILSRWFTMFGFHYILWSNHTNVSV